MKKEYIEHYSKCLNKQMHLCIYGHAGVTVLGFPTQDSNCHNYEDFGIIYHLSDFIEQGRIQIVTVDSVDKESWSCENGILSWRSARQEQYHNYIIEEVYPILMQKNTSNMLPIVTGQVLAQIMQQLHFFEDQNCLVECLRFLECTTVITFFMAGVMKIFIRTRQSVF